MNYSKMSFSILSTLYHSKLNVSVLDDQHRFVWGTKAVIDMCGFYSEDDMIGKTSSDIRCPAAELAEFYHAQNRDVMSSNTPQQYIGVTATYAKKQKLSLAYEKIPFYENDDSYVLIIVNDIKEIANDNKNLLCHLLTSREDEVLNYLIQGMTAKECGKTMSLSYRTVERHIANIKDKLQVRNQKQLVEKAISHMHFQYPR